MEDELQEAKDHFYIGNYAGALGMLENASCSNDLSQAERDALLARTYLCLGQYDKLKAMQSSDSPGQKAAALMAVFTKSRNEQQKASAKDRLVELAKSSHDPSTTSLAAMAHCAQNEFLDAVQLTEGATQTELQALRVQIFLMMNRLDMAEKQLRQLKATNDDSAVTRLADCAVNLNNGNSQEAFLTYCDLESQYLGEETDAVSPLLLNGKAVANMQRQLFTEAWEDLTRAATVAPNDPNTLVNMVCCSANMKEKNEEFAKHLKTLEDSQPGNPYVVKSKQMSDAFTRFAKSVPNKA